jgi:hypothetical protein
VTKEEKLVLWNKMCLWLLAQGAELIQQGIETENPWKLLTISIERMTLDYHAKLTIDAILEGIPKNE